MWRWPRCGDASAVCVTGRKGCLKAGSPGGAQADSDSEEELSRTRKRRLSDCLGEDDRGEKVRCFHPAERVALIIQRPEQDRRDWHTLP